MDADEAFTRLSAALRKLTDEHEQTQKVVAGLSEQFQLLLTILEARSELVPGHRRVLEKLRERAQVPAVQIELSDVADKYTVEGAEVDCGARMHLCHGRCCTFKVKMSRQDLGEAQLTWNIDQPYYLSKDANGYCVYQTRETGFCGTYQNRPAICRTYSCAGDTRVWIDFEKRIPAPMPETLVTIRRHVPKAD